MKETTSWTVYWGHSNSHSLLRTCKLKGNPKGGEPNVGTHPYQSGMGRGCLEQNRIERNKGLIRLLCGKVFIPSHME